MKWIFLVRSARKREKPDSGGPREYLEVDGRVSGGRIASGTMQPERRRTYWKPSCAMLPSRLGRKEVAMLFPRAVWQWYEQAQRAEARDFAFPMWRGSVETRPHRSTIRHCG